jgi:N-methylhydantoinase A
MDRAGAEFPSSQRRVAFDREIHEALMVWRDDLPRDAVVAGPAVISEDTATTVVPPGARAVVDRYGTLVVSVREDG